MNKQPLVSGAPNAFIVGAPKCGTTALAAYLSDHPEVYVSPVKEPHYFIKDDFCNWSKLSFEEYLALFAAADRQKVLLEASVWYLYSENAIRKIKEFCPSAKIIVMLRRPDEMVHSMHSQSYLTRDEDVEDFEIAWKLSQERKAGRHVPRKTREVKKLFYDEIAKYSEQMERLFCFFDRSQVLVVLYEDFRDDTAGVFKQVESFLGVEHNENVAFTRVNKNKSLKNLYLANFVRKPPPFLISFYLAVKRIAGFSGFRLLSKLKNLNEFEVMRRPLSKKMREEIIECYRLDIIKLSELIERDLSAWLR